MTTDGTIEDGKLQWDINREAAKMPSLQLGKVDKYEYLAGEQILLPDQRIILERAKFTYHPLSKAFEKQIKTIEEKGRIQAEALEVSKLNIQISSIKDTIRENTLNENGKLNKHKKIENGIKRKFTL